jgi:Lrp/AsnC family transcriptional regulator, regulator for asnA, asnC and gidA
LRKAQDIPEVQAPALDHIDRRVVAALQADGRRSFASIADELDVAESVVRYRVQRLERAGILQVVGIADPLKIGFDLMAMVGVQVRPGEAGAVASALAQLQETSYVAAVAGQYDLFVELVCRDTAHFQQLLTHGLHSVEGVVRTESFLILEIHKMAYGWGVGDHGVPLADEIPLPEPEPDAPLAASGRAARNRPSRSLGAGPAAAAEPRATRTNRPRRTAS